MSSDSCARGAGVRCKAKKLFTRTEAEKLVEQGKAHVLRQTHSKNREN